MKRLVTFLFVALITLAACGTLTDDGTGLLFATADPHLSVGVRLLPAPPVPPASTPAIVPPTAVPTEEPLLPTVTPTPCIIKGNIAADGTRIAHSPGQANYENVVISPEKGEKCFGTLEEAIAEGWRAAQR